MGKKNGKFTYKEYRKGKGSKENLKNYMSAKYKWNIYSQKEIYERKL